VTSNPGIGPNKASAFARVPFPRFISLSNRSVAIKPDLDFVKAIGNEIFRRIARVRDHLRFAVRSTLWINTREVIGKNALNRAGVAAGN
jgi:hypothetical protein